jgi:hypothetical protein
MAEMPCENPHCGGPGERRIDTVAVDQAPIAVYLCNTCYLAYETVQDRIYRPNTGDTNARQESNDAAPSG